MTLLELLPHLQAGKNGRRKIWATEWGKELRFVFVRWPCAGDRDGVSQGYSATQEREPAPERYPYGAYIFCIEDLKATDWEVIE